jgi:hypothetical protein
MQEQERHMHTHTYIHGQNGHYDGHLNQQGTKALYRGIRQRKDTALTAGNARPSCKESMLAEHAVRAGLIIALSCTQACAGKPVLHADAGCRTAGDPTWSILTFGARHPTRNPPCGTLCLMTEASATRTSIKSPPGMRSNKKYKWYLGEWAWCVCMCVCVCVCTRVCVCVFNGKVIYHLYLM